jgi:DNA polymerase-1
VVHDAAQLPAAVADLRADGTIALATVTDAPDPLRGRLIGLALAGAGAGAWYFPLGHRGGDGMFEQGEQPANLPPLDDVAMAPLRDLLADPAVAKGGHDVKRDWLALRTAGVPLAGIRYDSMLASFLLDPGKRSHLLDAICTEHLGRVVRPPLELARPGRDGTPVARLPVAEVGRCATQAAAAVLELRDRMAARLEGHGLARLLEEVEVPLIGVLADMEWRGIAVDPALLNALARQFGVELEQIEREIYREAGTEFNINSTPQLRHVLFEKLQLPVQKKTKTGASTDADVLQQLAELGFPVPRLLLEYRELSKLKSTYVDVLPQSINPRTGRIHTQFNQTGAATGRLSSSDPNLQNIPVRTTRGEQIRRCFVAAPGCRLVVADYSQIELRLLAHLSEDPVFIGAFERGGDIHRETAAIIFEVPAERVTAEMRARAKTINFATIYGQGPFALSRQLNISVEQARDFIRRYFERFAGVRRYLDATVERARRDGYVETIRGRRRYIPELKDPNFNIRAFGERTAMNSPLQGSAADLIKTAMISVARELAVAAPGSGMVLQVHDELLVEAPEAEVEAASAVVRREMESAAALRVPLVVDVGVGANWLDAKH